MQNNPSIFQKFGHFLIENPLGSLAVIFFVVAAATLGMPVFWAAMIILSFSVLLQPNRTQLGYLVCAALIPWVVSTLWHGSSLYVIHGVVGTIVTVFVARLLLYGHSWPLLVEGATVLGLVGISGLYLVYPDLPAQWLQWVSEGMSKAAWNKAQSTQAMDMLRLIAPYVMGMEVLGVLTTAILYTLVGLSWLRNVLSKHINITGGQYIRLSYTMLSALVVSAAVVYLTQDYQGILCIYALPTVAASLSLFHFLVNKKGQKKHIFIGYIGLFAAFLLSSFLVFVILVTISVMDCVFDFRQMLEKASTS